MKINTLNFEMVLKNYKPYNDGLGELESYKEDFNKKVEGIKAEMEQIVSSSRLLVLDQTTKEKNALRIRELQAEGIRLESEFRNAISEKQNSILEDCFKQISKFVDDWANINGVDFVLNQNSVVWGRENLDITPEIISTLMEKDLYFDYIGEKISE
jgi:Skp family chaperone for outer membrane proteins